MKRIVILLLISLLPISCKINVPTRQRSKYESLASKGEFKASIRALCQDLQTALEIDPYLHHFDMLKEKMTRGIIYLDSNEDRLPGLEDEMAAIAKDALVHRKGLNTENRKSIDTLKLLPGETEQEVDSTIRDLKLEKELAHDRLVYKKNDIKALRLESDSLKRKLVTLHKNNKRGRRNSEIEAVTNLLKVKTTLMRAARAEYNELKLKRELSISNYNTYLVDHNALADPVIVSRLLAEIDLQSKLVLDKFVDYVFSNIVLSIKTGEDVYYKDMIETYLRFDKHIETNE